MKSRLVLSVIGVFCAAALFAQGGGTQFGLSAENPGISVVGDFIGHYNITEDKGFLGIGEVELGFQAYVDPFARVDVFIGYHGIELAHHNHDDDDDDHEHGLEVEEAVLTLTSLPFGFQFQTESFTRHHGSVGRRHVSRFGHDNGIVRGFEYVPANVHARRDADQFKTARGEFERAHVGYVKDIASALERTLSVERYFADAFDQFDFVRFSDGKFSVFDG